MKRFCEKNLLKAVCFDFRGVLLDHKTNKEFVPGMEGLLRTLKNRDLVLGLISRFPKEILVSMLGQMRRFFGNDIYSSGGQGKFDCIKALAKKHGIGSMARIAFVDDKPDNLLPVSQTSKVYVIGFLGSGRYPEARDACRTHGIAFAEDVEELRALLMAHAGRKRH